MEAVLVLLVMAADADPILEGVVREVPLTGLVGCC